MKPVNKLSKFIHYVLGRRPDEFGLIPDDQGFVKIKSLLHALHEDPEWRHVRPSHINELRMSVYPGVIEIQDSLIRAVERSQLPRMRTPHDIPKLLYTAVRHRAYPVVSVDGVKPYGGQPYVVLSPDLQMAQRLGQRLDNEPVLLTVQGPSSLACGVQYQQYGPLLYLAPFLPADTFSGPPLQKEAPAPAKPEMAQAPAQPKTPGSYFPDFAAGSGPKTGTPTRIRRNEAEWKKERRKARKDKARR